MRCFLLKLGFIGDAYRDARRVILAGLPGDGSHNRSAAEPARDMQSVISAELYDPAEALADAALIHSVNELFDSESGAAV
jgi:hypothetical protein